MREDLIEVFPAYRARFMLAVAVTAVMLATNSVRGDETSWIGPPSPPASQVCMAPSNWTNGLPTTSIDANISNGNLARVRGDSNQPIAAGAVYIGKGSGESGTVMTQDGSALSTSVTHVGYSGTGALLIGEDTSETGSRFKATTLYVGTLRGGSGSVELRAERSAAYGYSLDAAAKHIGYAGAGTVIGTQGMNSTAHLYLGTQTTGRAPTTKRPALVLSLGVFTLATPVQASS